MCPGPSSLSAPCILHPPSRATAPSQLMRRSPDGNGQDHVDPAKKIIRNFDSIVNYCFQNREWQNVIVANKIFR